MEKKEIICPLCGIDVPHINVKQFQGMELCDECESVCLELIEFKIDKVIFLTYKEGEDDEESINFIAISKQNERIFSLGYNLDGELELYMSAKYSVYNEIYNYINKK